MSKREPTVFEDNPFIEGLLEWMNSPQGQLADEARELVWPMLENAGVDAKKRKILWQDGQRLSIPQTARRIHTRYPRLSSDLIEDKIMTWLETFAPESYSPERLDELDELVEEWQIDHYRQGRSRRKTRENSPLLRKIVFDKYHVASHLGNAVDLVRRQENKQLRLSGDDRLVGTKYDWLTNPENFTAAAWREFGALRKSDLRTARAWALKESAMRLFDYTYEGAARRHFQSWCNWATHSRLKAIIAVAKMLKRRFENVITYLKHPITNAIAEGINSQIQWVKYTARGFRNKVNFVTAIYFHCGGLDLMPKST